jgi:hypothetical protein
MAARTPVKLIHYFSALCLAGCALLVSPPALTQAATPALPSLAVLRCDPGLMIMSIDGDKKRRVSRDESRLDCNVVLKPGRHQLVARFEWTQPGYYFNTKVTSRREEHVEFQIVENRIYRLKGTDEPAWKAWVEDVTDREAKLPSVATASKRWRKTLPAGQRTSVAVMKIAPSNTFVGTYYGRTQGPWFYPGQYVPVYIPKEAWDLDDYAIGDIEAGAVIGIENAIVNGNAFSLNKQHGTPCGETLVPVFENLDGGKVYFLGSFAFESTPSGMMVRFTQEDLKGAAEFLRSRRPELAGTIEPASFRLVRKRIPCDGIPVNEVWRNLDPGSAPSISPAASAAN